MPLHGHPCLYYLLRPFCAYLSLPLRFGRGPARPRSAHPGTLQPSRGKLSRSRLRGLPPFAHAQLGSSLERLYGIGLDFPKGAFRTCWQLSLSTRVAGFSSFRTRSSLSCCKPRTKAFLKALSSLLRVAAGVEDALPLFPNAPRPLLQFKHALQFGLSRFSLRPLQFELSGNTQHDQP